MPLQPPRLSYSSGDFQQQGLPYTYHETEEPEPIFPAVFMLFFACGLLYLLFRCMTHLVNDNMREMERQRILWLEEGRGEVARFLHMYRGIEDDQHEHV